MVRLQLLRPEQHLTRRALIVHRRILIVACAKRVDLHAREAYLHDVVFVDVGSM